MYRWGLLAVLLCACAAPPQEAAAPTRGGVQPATRAPVPGEELVPGRILVELFARPGATPEGQGLVLGQGATVEALAVPAPPVPSTGLSLGGVAVRVVREIYSGAGPEEDGGLPLLLLDSGARDEAGTRADLGRIAKDPLVRRAEPDRLRRPAAAPNDPQLPVQWGLRQVNMNAAWDRAQGSESVTVAILDTGILKDHPDLRNRLVPGYDFVSDNENAGDGQPGRDGDPEDTGTSDPGSSNLHGSHVAGIIGADSNNGRGVAGVDWKCRLMPVRVLGVKGGTGTDSDIADAIRWTLGKQLGGLPRSARTAQVINMSFGGLGVSFTVQRAVDEAIAAGAIVVAAAGNGGADATTYSPGGLDGVITVGASTSKRARASYSNHGPRVDLLAPGGDDLDDGAAVAGIVSTYRDLGQKDPKDPMVPYTYYPLEGTSQAAPHVAGAAALVRSLVPVRQLTMAALMRNTADHSSRCDLDPDGGCGAGLLNVDALLQLARLQDKCGCSGDRYCFDGQCIDPGYPHPSIFADPVVRGGCQAAGPSPAPAAGALSPLGLAALGLLRRRRRVSSVPRPAAAPG